MKQSLFVLKASAVVLLGLLAMATSQSRAETRMQYYCATSCAKLNEMNCGQGSSCTIAGCIGVMSL